MTTQCAPPPGAESCGCRLSVSWHDADAGGEHEQEQRSARMRSTRGVVPTRAPSLSVAMQNDYLSHPHPFGYREACRAARRASTHLGGRSASTDGANAALRVARGHVQSASFPPLAE